MNKITKNTNREKGQSLMEFSISLVILLTLIAGIVDLGRAFFTYITLRDAAQEGASFASVASAEPISDVTAYCSAISNRVIITTEGLVGDDSSGPINLNTLSDELNVETQITWLDEYDNAHVNECTAMAAENICLGSAVRVTVEYDSFPMTMPFMGAIIGSQTISLSANVIDSILTPACQ